ncbi:MAG: hypothetical protein HQL70_01835 [Magnetococcales bacterium]|nr:hypothetical protein [Magnetococcales bacterium]
MADITGAEEGEIESNALFLTYGGIVDSFFADGKEAGEPISVVPANLNVSQSPVTDTLPPITFSDSVEDHEDSKDDAETALSEESGEKSPEDTTTLVTNNLPKKELEKIQELVDGYRRVLSKKSKSGDRVELGEEEQLLASYLKDFRSALKSEDESALESNPFYDLTKQIYKLNLDGVSEAFQKISKGGDEPLPRSIFVARSLKEIWSGSNSSRNGFFNKLSETFGKWMAFFRTPLSLLLFVGSTYTTARGVNDLLQMDDVGLVFGDLFAGSSGEANRYIVCLASGLVLSSAILDYKTRIFQSMVECGLVFKGIKDAFLRFPRWMILATLLAFVSVKTNYDGIVSIISKKEDLAQQSQIITSRVRKAIGSPFFMNANDPDSLFDLQASLQQTTREIRGVFRTLPEDEIKGVASSGDPRKGPRYWAKHFIVHGGYEPGVNDVKLAFNDHRFARQIDDMLKNSGIDFSSSFSEKVEILRGKYEDHLNSTDSLVRKYLGELNVLMSMGGYSLDEIKRVLALEHYQINDIVQIIVNALEENKQAYKETTVDLSELTNTYLGILQMVDKSGTSGLSSYQVKAEVVVPKIEAIDELRKGKIPAAKHKNFEELRESLMLKYGISLGGMLLISILFFSISMDFGDPIVYSRMTARRGKKDRVFYKDRLAKLKKWEDEFFRKASLFFENNEVREVFLDPQPPGETLVKNGFYLLLEKVNFELKDHQDKTGYERFDSWFQGMFRFSRTADMAGLNNRLASTRTILSKPSRYFPDWGKFIYPDFCLDKTFKRSTFLEWHTEKQRILEEQRVNFYQELRDISKSQPGLVSNSPTDLSPRQKRLADWADKKGMTFVGRALMAVNRFWFIMFQAVKKEPLAGFSYTRRGWLKAFSEDSQESEKIVESIYSFIPDLKKVVFETLPYIQESYLDPILEFLAKYPGYDGYNDVLNGEKLQKQFEEIEKEALDLWGVSFFATDDPGGYLGLSSIMTQEEINNLQEMVAKTGTDSVVFSRRVEKLTSDMKQAYVIVSTTEEINHLLTQVRTICVDVNQSLMKIKMRAWELRSSGTANANQFLNTATDLQTNAPKEADSILSVMEAILQSNQPYTRENLATLRTLYQQSSELQDRIMAFVDVGKDSTTTTQDYSPIAPVMSEPVYEEPEATEEVLAESMSEVEEQAAVVEPYTHTRHNLQEMQSPEDEVEQSSEAVIPTFIQDDFDDDGPVVMPSLPEADESVVASRQEERINRKVFAIYQTSRGALFEGYTGEIGTSSLDFISNTDPSMLPIGNEGILQVTVDDANYQFAGKVVRVSDARIVVRVLAEQDKFKELLAPMA